MHGYSLQLQCVMGMMERMYAWLYYIDHNYIVLQEVPVGVRQKLLGRIGDFA